MELQLNYKIKKAETEKIALPNLKESCLLPTKIKFSVQELEFSLFSLNNSLFRYGEPYFRVFDEIDLSDYRNKIGEGDDLTMMVKNLSKKELDLGITIVYEKQVGNIIFINTYHDNQVNFDRCLEDFSGAGYITQLIIDAEQPISSVILDPIYKIKPKTPISNGSSETTDEETVDPIDLEEHSNWVGYLGIQNAKPTPRVILDFTSKKQRAFVKYLKFYRLKIAFAPDASANSGTGDKSTRVHLIGYGYKSDKR